MTKSLRNLTTAALTATLLAAPGVAHADQVDQVLRALPAGEISCDQAARYWTNEADYNSKVSQANMLAMVHPRGPQIRDALARIDDAANRCGLKGGGAPAPAPAEGGAPAPAPAPAGAIMSSAPGLPSINIQLPGGIWVTVPNLQQMVADFLGRFGIHI